MSDNYETRNAWLKSLKVGDSVVLKDGSILNRAGDLQKITRETTTRWFIRINDRVEIWVSKINGAGPKGDRYMERTRIFEATPEWLQTSHKSRLARKLAGLNWESYPLQVLENVAAMVAGAASIEPPTDVNKGFLD